MVHAVIWLDQLNWAKAQFQLMLKVSVCMIRKIVLKEAFDLQANKLLGINLNMALLKKVT
ncbi:Uncharacterised protein [Acinetobacter baumannii]|nr:Uncharacterised protein [Acinetobacter baumannii]